MSDADESLRERLAAGSSMYDALLTDMRGREPADVYRLLFPIAVRYGLDGADTTAGLLLVEIDPDCPVSCEEALAAVGSGRWQVSDRLVPFYLVSQFGKRHVRATVEAILGRGELPDRERNAIHTIGYWTAVETVRLLEPFAEWRPHHDPDS